MTERFAKLRDEFVGRPEELIAALLKEFKIILEANNTTMEDVLDYMQNFDKRLSDLELKIEKQNETPKTT